MYSFREHKVYGFSVMVGPEKCGYAIQVPPASDVFGHVAMKRVLEHLHPQADGSRWVNPPEQSGAILLPESVSEESVLWIFDAEPSSAASLAAGMLGTLVRVELDLMIPFASGEETFDSAVARTVDSFGADKLETLLSIMPEARGEILEMNIVAATAEKLRIDYAAKAQQLKEFVRFMQESGFSHPSQLLLS